MNRYLKAPFPYFGGKSAVAARVWRALGDVRHYMEPFFGSGAVLLARPNYNPSVHVETVCGKAPHLANVWRALQFAPDEVARWCDWPVNHVDLAARRRVLIENEDYLLENLVADPEWYDAKLAGYWIWVAGCWIGSGMTREPRDGNDARESGKVPLLSRAGQGVHAIGQVPILSNAGQGVHAIGQVPHLGTAGRGVHAIGQVPNLGDSGKGVHAVSLRDEAEEPIPFLGHGERGPHADDVRAPYNTNLYAWFRALSERLRYVRVVCGDWTRVCGGDWQDSMGTVGIFFDPPYGVQDRSMVYDHDSRTVADAVRAWCIERGRRPTYRIVLAGYDEHEELAEHGWRKEVWRANGGYANQGKGKAQGKMNRLRETLWFSPYCLDQQMSLLELE